MQEPENECGTTVFWGSEDGRENDGENGWGETMKGYQPRGSLYLSRGVAPIQEE